MPISLAQLKGNLRTINVPYFNDNLSVTYRPSELTPQNTSEIQAKIASGDAENVVIETLCRVLVSWDVVDVVVDKDGNTVMDDKGEPKTVAVPIDQETLSRVPGPLLLAISEAISEDARPKRKSAGRSFAR